MTPSAAPTAREVAETPAPRADVPIWTHPEWAERFPWLVQGTTGAGTGQPFDLALFGQGRPGEIMERWWALGRATGATRLVHGHQVHRAAVRVHDAGPPGLQVCPATDGHVTRAPGVLLAVTIADCVPVSLVDPDSRTVALLHAGWRGVAADILEHGLEIFAGRLALEPDRLHMHLGPAICGRCYEVGPEVHRGLGLPEPAGPSPVDLRAVLTDRALRAGLRAEHVSSSSWCTRCGDSPFFSHRGGRPERQVAFLGVR
jgi:YfiH family protein